MSGEDPETYLRRFAETQLRRLAAGKATAAECAALVDSVAVAFEETGALDREVTARVGDDLWVALVARSLERGVPRSRRLGYSALRGRPGSRDVLARHRALPRNAFTREDVPGNIAVVPAGAVLRPRGEDGDEDVYLLSYVSASGRAWFSVAARTSEPLVPRRHASPPSARNPRVRPTAGYRPTFAGGGMTAVDDAGREYDLRFSGGGDSWYLGRLLVNPVPPPDAKWLEVHSGDDSARINLRTAPPRAEVTALALTDDPGESYLRRQAESLLGSRNGVASLLMPAVTGLSVVVPALRAVGLLADSSPVPGQVAAFIERLGGPGRRIAEPEEMPERWTASVTSAPAAEGDRPVAAAHLAAVLPETDKVTAYLTGLVTLPGTGTLLFGGLRTASHQAGEPIPRRTLWLRDDMGGWHSVTIQGSAGRGKDHTFQASAEPPVGPDVSRVQFCVTGPETEVRADIPLTWWTP